MIRRNQQGVYVPRRSSSLAAVLSGQNSTGEQISKMAMDSNNFGSGYAGAWGALAQGLTAGIGAWTQKKEQDREMMARQAFAEQFPEHASLASQLSPESREAISAKILMAQLENNAPTPQSSLGKLAADYQNGLIDPKAYNAAIRKETMFAGDRATPAPSGFRYTRDGNLEPIPGGPADQKRQIEMQNDTSQLDTLISNLDSMQGNIARLNAHPGKKGITGFRGALPNMPGTDAADAQAELDTLNSKTFVNALTSLRAASKTGAAVGGVSDKEGDKLQNSFQALNNSQSTEQFTQNLDRLYQDIEASKANIRNAYGRKYGTYQQPQQQPQPQSFNGFKVLKVRNK